MSEDDLFKNCEKSFQEIENLEPAESTHIADSIGKKPAGRYTRPRMESIAGIETLIVDPHNEVLPHWYKAGESAVLIHVDKHADMRSNALTLEAAKRQWAWDNINSREKYARECLTIANFTSVAVNDGIVSLVYHIDPRHNAVHAYGRVQGKKLRFNPTTYIDKEGRIRWDCEDSSPIPEEISNEELTEDIVGSQYPLILNLDLDAFLCFDDQVDQPASVCANRMRIVMEILRGLPRPNVITIARSQTPSLWCPSERVDNIEKETKEYLQTLYS
jgi:hypothetical protein